MSEPGQRVDVNTDRDVVRVRQLVRTEAVAVQLSLAVQPEDLWHVLKSALSRQSRVAVATGQAGWDRLQEQVVARAAPATGVGVIEPGRDAAPAALIPREPPDWAVRQADAQAIAERDAAFPRHTRREPQRFIPEAGGGEMRRQQQFPCPRALALEDAAPARRARKTERRATRHPR